MDNKAYLDQIAVKGKIDTKSAISPTLIKLIIAGVIALITLIAVGVIINNSNAKVTQNYERIYLRMGSIVNDEGAIKLNVDKIKDSDLRSQVSTLITVMTTSYNTLQNLAPNIGVNPEKITKSVQNDEDSNNAMIATEIDNSVMTGTVDEAYGTEMYYQINTLIAYMQEAQKKNTNQEFANLLNKALTDLLQLQTQFKKYNNSSN